MIWRRWGWGWLIAPIVCFTSGGHDGPLDTRDVEVFVEEVGGIDKFGLRVDWAGGCDIAQGPAEGEEQVDFGRHDF